MVSQHGIIGDEFPTELPETQQDDEAFLELQKSARFSKTQEFKELKKHLESRIEFYQQYLPDGRSVISIIENLGPNWIAANCIVGELKAVLNAYEMAAEQVKDAIARRKRP